MEHNQFTSFSPGSSPSFVHADIHLLGRFQPFSPGTLVQQKPPPLLAAAPPHNIIQQAQHKSLQQFHQQRPLQHQSHQQPHHQESHPPLSEHLRVPPLSFARPAAFVPPAELISRNRMLAPAASTLLARSADTSQQALARPSPAGCLLRGINGGARTLAPHRPAQAAMATTLSDFLQRAQAMQDRAMRLWAEENQVLQRGTELQIITPLVAATISPKRPRCNPASPPHLNGDGGSAYNNSGQGHNGGDGDATCHISSPLTRRQDECDSPACCSPNVLDSLTAYLMQPGSTPATAHRAGPFSGQFSSHGVLFDSAGAVLAALSSMPEGNGGGSSAGDALHR